MKSQVSNKHTTANALEEKADAVDATKATGTSASDKYDARLLGAEDHSKLSLVELRLPQRTPRALIHARYHSVLAMEAAKKMRRSRQKLKTGQEVCHHLKMMLATDLPTNKAAMRRQAGKTEPQFRLGF